MNIKSTLAFLAIAIGARIGSSSFQVYATGVWTAPSSPPPSGQVDAPLNAGSASQTKTGLLGLANLLVTSLNVATGTPGLGKVLTDVTGYGDVGWANLPTTNNNVLLCHATVSDWTYSCGNILHLAGEVLASDHNNASILSTSTASISARQACAQNNYNYLGYTYFLTTGPGGGVYNACYYDGTNWQCPGYYSSHANEYVVGSIYCSTRPIVPPQGLLQ